MNAGTRDAAAALAMQILVYGLRQGQTERYTEELLASRCKTQADIDAVKRAAGADGWHSFRVTTSDGSPPDFAAAVRVQRRP